MTWGAVLDILLVLAFVFFLAWFIPFFVNQE
jgi:hypothetical protein